MKYLLFIIMTLLASCFGKTPEKTGMEGKTIPEFSLQMSDSITWLNTKDIKSGIPSVFFLFSVDCPYCKSQLSKIVSNKSILKDIPIYMITPEPYAVMKQFYTSNHLDKCVNIKMCRDTADFFGNYMSVKKIPFVALYDKNKKLMRAFSGPTSPQLIKSILTE